MKVCLPMYDLPEARAATDAWWAGLAGHLRQAGIDDVPGALDRDTPREEVWLGADLLLAQTCGYPLTHALAGRVRYVATPCYAAPGCDGADYRSLLVVARDSRAETLADLRGRRCAVNGLDSHSGHNVLRAEVAALGPAAPFFGSMALSGGHRASIALVARGAADIAAVDCITYALLEKHAPAELAAVRVLGRTMSAPGLPWIARRGASDAEVARIRAGLSAALADDVLRDVRAALLLNGAEVLPPHAYQRIVEMEAAGVDVRLAP